MFLCVLAPLLAYASIMHVPAGPCVGYAYPEPIIQEPQTEEPRNTIKSQQLLRSGLKEGVPDL
jgi:hypothetical protein